MVKVGFPCRSFLGAFQSEEHLKEPLAIPFFQLIAESLFQFCSSRIEQSVCGQAKITPGTTVCGTKIIENMILCVKAACCNNLHA